MGLGHRRLAKENISENHRYYDETFRSGLQDNETLASKVESLKKQGDTIQGNGLSLEALKS